MGQHGPRFPDQDSKTDNFKVKAQAPLSKLDVVKFYDANANGLDDDNLPITGWKITCLTCGTAHGLLHAGQLAPVPFGNYQVSEAMPVQTNWTPDHRHLGRRHPPARAYVEFGNLCVGAGGGLTLGFWSNKNGGALIGADDLRCSRAEPPQRDGPNFDPTEREGLPVLAAGRKRQQHG